jgi:hypothetical protein
VLFACHHANWNSTARAIALRLGSASWLKPKLDIVLVHSVMHCICQGLVAGWREPVDNTEISFLQAHSPVMTVVGVIVIRT